jgi:chaperonin cofactor prefoldin
MNDRLNELEAELARIAGESLDEQPQAFAELKAKLEEQLNSATDASNEI